MEKERCSRPPGRCARTGLMGKLRQLGAASCLRESRGNRKERRWNCHGGRSLSPSFLFIVRPVLPHPSLDHIAPACRPSALATSPLRSFPPVCNIVLCSCPRTGGGACSFLPLHPVFASHWAPIGQFFTNYILCYFCDFFVTLCRRVTVLIFFFVLALLFLCL